MKKQDNSGSQLPHPHPDAGPPSPLGLGWGKLKTLLGLTSLFLCVSVAGALAQSTPDDDSHKKRCANPIIEAQLQQRSPNRLQQVDKLNEQVRAFGQLGTQARSTSATVYRIPVVVHVVHNQPNGLIGGANNPNITDAQIQSQIDVLNEDYRKAVGTPGGTSTNPVAVDTNIEFYLATQDPNGAPSTGVVRTYYAAKNSFDLFNDLYLLSDISYWPSNRYLNIWVVALSNRNYLGFGQFPTAADTLQGLDDTNERIDGVVIDHRYFGRRTGTVTSSLYCCGRTTTHEVGHWLGLIHPNGDTRCGDDYVADTPPIEGLNETDKCDPIFSACRSGARTQNLIENYMDYTPDACMNVFTAGQRDRMAAVLQLSPRRLQLILANTALPETEQLNVLIYPNPSSSQSIVRVQFKGLKTFDTELIDANGRTIQADTYPATLSREITLPVASLQAGVYIFRVKTQNETVSQRVLIQ
ncbi:M43 family zinc metalloprotease [Fibrella aquatica]|uniref:M43 family zinc metalloprotease n=1 Tax=Fibrella aquatica TaxID=3242487 RepID=UPI003521EC45